MSLPVWPMNWQAPELNNWRGMQNVSANSSLLVWSQLGQLSQVLMPPIQTGALLLNMLTNTIGRKGTDCKSNKIDGVHYFAFSDE